jgi:predicted secreted protein
MARRITVFLLCSLFSVSLFAGDVAQFIDMGFSSDGFYYMFGQYGVEDSSWRGYADLYTIDVKKNDFVPAGVFSTPPSAATAGKTGKELFDELVKKADPVIKKYALSVNNNGEALYVMSEDSGKQNIRFREFDSDKKPGQIWWEVRVNTLLDEKKNTSSFYLIVDKNEDGAVGRRYLAGSPGVQRKDVFRYNIRRIIPDKKGVFLVFVMEKEMNASRGKSVRFMVETLAL